MVNFFDQFDSASSATDAAKAQPRGIRNNNPLNIEAGGYTKSQDGFQGSDGRFAKFENMDQGFAAAENLLGTYHTKHGINTVAGVINRWAPASDGNPVSAYAKSVADDLGVDASHPIDLANPVVRARVASSMAKFENGTAVPRSTDISAQSKPKGNFFDQFDAKAETSENQAVKEVAPPTFGERFAGDGTGPGLAQQPTTSAPERVLTDFNNTQAAAGQRTTPNVAAQYKNLVSDRVQEGDDGNAYFVDPKSGKLEQADKAKHVILTDPNDGKLKVYGRTEDTNEGVLSSAGRMLTSGMATGTPTRLPGGVGTLASSVAPAAPKALSEGQQVAQAAERVGVEVPRALASDSMATQRAGQAIRNVPIVGDAIPKATARLTTQLGDATANVASEFGGGSGTNVAHKIGQVIGGAAEREGVAARAAAQNSDQAVLAAWERNIQGATSAVERGEAQALTRARQAVGDLSPQDMGETLIARLRAGEQEARATKERLYGVASNSDGQIAASAVSQVRGRVAQVLDDAGRVIDELTPASSKMMDELQKFSSLNIGNKAVGARLPGAGDETIAAVNMQGMEQVRKRLNNMSQAATNDADRSAARTIIREFDNWQGDAFDRALFSGSDEALQSFRAARAANAEWRTRFGFNARDDADRIVNRIVTGEVTPQEVANWVVGATKVGGKGVSSRLLARVAEATGGDPEAMQAIRGGVWNRLSAVTEGATPKSSEKIASDINEFLNGSGRDVARRLFTDAEQSIMRTYSNALRQGERARETITGVAANTKPSLMDVGIGPLQKLANDVLGKGGGRSDEALYSAINAYAKSNARGDINLLSKVLQAIPQQERGNLASAMIRDMGVSPRTGQFSPDVFVSTWGTYKPEAKALLFGMAGPQRAALDDIAKISLRVKEVGSRFGNPSGTAQNVNFFAMASGALAAPLTTLTGALGGAAVARMLAAPAVAPKVAQWSRAYERAAVSPTVQNVEQLNRASSMLAVNVYRDVGMPVKDIVRQLQGPVPVAAENENQ